MPGALIGSEKFGHRATEKDRQRERERERERENEHL